MILLVPFLLGQKKCDNPKWEHIKIEKGMACTDCHEDGRTKETPPASHDPAWKRNHGKFMGQYGFKKSVVCTVCHTESKCATCHQQEKPRDHNEFFRLRSHGLSVGLDRSRCLACHNADFCERCHATVMPVDHRAGWGAPTNRHCLSCHFPLASAGAQKCAVCHNATPSHVSAPSQPANSLHAPGANCRSCHTPLRHPDNGMVCLACHPR